LENFLSGINFTQIAAQLIALLIAIVGHEIMHGAAAYSFGDTTAKDNGRLSVNPIKHIDPIGTIALPALLLVTGSGFLFGWAKPVPVNITRVLEGGGNRGMVIVSLAGIAYNLALAFIGAFLFHTLFTPADEAGFLAWLLAYTVLWNVVLALFNLLPIPPLDGANALSYSASAFGFNGVSRVFDRIGAYGFFILLAILMTDLKIPLFKVIGAIVDLLI
jgi:Zn-dependent protease